MLLRARHEVVNNKMHHASDFKSSERNRANLSPSQCVNPSVRGCSNGDTARGLAKNSPLRCVHPRSEENSPLRCVHPRSEDSLEDSGNEPRGAALIEIVGVAELCAQQPFFRADARK